MMRSKIKQARDRIEALRVALLSPAAEQIGAALPGLEEAALCLQTVEQKMREGAAVANPVPYEICRELTLLKNDLRIIAPLIAHGVAFSNAWARMLGAGPTYTPSGQPSPPEQFAGSGTTLSLRG
ncbi:MAG: hypothetical protein ABSF12_22370 [Bryobacteraceae bacterium]|jgi:hypothetical protein